MVSYGNHFQDRTLITIDDAEREAMEKITSKSAVKQRPALWAFSDVLNSSVQLVQKCVREGSVAL